MQRSYIIRTLWGVSNASKRGRNQKSPTNGKMAYKTPCRLTALYSSQGALIRKLAPQPLPCGEGEQRLKAGGEHEKWPRNVQIGYIILTVCGVPNGSKRGEKKRRDHQKNADMWENWLRTPCLWGHAHRSKARLSIKSGTQMGKLANSLLPFGVSPRAANVWARGVCDSFGGCNGREPPPPRGGRTPLPPLVDPNLGGRAVNRRAPLGAGGGCSVGTPTYKPQNDPHCTLIILGMRQWGKKVFKKNCPSTEAPISQASTGRLGRGQNPFWCFSGIFEFSTQF